jgi:hypothetical protein
VGSPAADARSAPSKESEGLEASEAAEASGGGSHAGGLRSKVRRPRPSFDAPFEGARLLAFRLAVAGKTREQVEIELGRAFPDADSGALLEGVFGGEGSEPSGRFSRSGRD